MAKPYTIIGPHTHLLTIHLNPMQAASNFSQSSDMLLCCCIFPGPAAGTRSEPEPLPEDLYTMHVLGLGGEVILNRLINCKFWWCASVWLGGSDAGHCGSGVRLQTVGFTWANELDLRSEIWWALLWRMLWRNVEVMKQRSSRCLKTGPSLAQSQWQCWFEESGKDVLVNCFAPWCGHCQKFKPKYQVHGREFVFAKDVKGRQAKWIK